MNPEQFSRELAQLLVRDEPVERIQGILSVQLSAIENAEYRRCVEFVQNLTLAQRECLLMLMRDSALAAASGVLGSLDGIRDPAPHVELRTSTGETWDPDLQAEFLAECDRLGF